MDIRLIALDLDGTLLDSKKRLSPVNKQALCDCIERDIYIVPTTGRTVDGIPDAVKRIPGIRYAITTNGAVIEDMDKHQALDTRKLSCQQASRLLDIISTYSVMYDAYIDGRGVSETRFFDHMDDYHLSPEFQEMVRKTRDVYPDIRRHVLENGGEVEKINVFFADTADRPGLRAALETVEDIVITSSMPFNLEINALEATKGDAILRLASHLRLNKDQTMAFGDGENDMSMIRQAGTGVAMGNGLPELKAAASYVTSTNDEDGVAEAIKKLVLE